MKLKLIFTLLTLVGCSITAFSQFERFNSFDELDQLSRKYVQTNKLDSAILAIEYAMKEFPDNDEKQATFSIFYIPELIEILVL